MNIRVERLLKQIYITWALSGHLCWDVVFNCQFSFLRTLLLLFLNLSAYVSFDLHSVLF